MDLRIVVGVVVLAVAVGFLLLNNSGPVVETPTTEAPSEEPGTTPAEEGETTEEEPVEEEPEDVLPLVRLEEVEGNCTLMHSNSLRRYNCFGCAGEWCEYPDSRWALASSDKYFCKPMEGGCKLYQKVELNR